VNGSKVFKIIDVKSSDVMKISHKIQIAVYALMLYFILRENEIEGEVDFNEGGIWLYGEKEPRWFKMGYIMPHIEQFLYEIFPVLSNVAIISYGVADPELVTNEGEFIYSLNRLNVAITRAKAKVIVFISKNLLSPSLDILANEKYSEGVGFMLSLEKYALDGGEPKVYDIDGVKLNIYRRK